MLNDLVSECLHCRDAVRSWESLREALRANGVNLQTEVDHPERGPAFNANVRMDSDITCNCCHGRRYVLTQGGKLLAQLIEDAVV